MLQIANKEDQNTGQKKVSKNAQKKKSRKRKILPDPKYKDIVVAKFMNNLMKDGGKKSVAEKIVYGAFDKIHANENNDPIEVFNKLFPRLDQLWKLNQDV